MRVLVTGSSGFIGSHLSRSLIKAGHLVVGVDVNPAALKLAGSHCFSILDRDYLKQAFKRDGPFDAIAHLAAGVGPDAVASDPYATTITNVEGTHNLLNAARLYSPHSFFLFTSTSEVYGNSPVRPFSEDSSPLVLGPGSHPRWSYAHSKLAAEQLVLARGGCVARIFNTTGPGQSESYVLPRFVGMALRGEDITLYGDGSQVRCFCHVRDMVRALTLLIERGVKPKEPNVLSIFGEVFNVGSDQETTIHNLAAMVRNQIDREVSIIKVPESEAPNGSMLIGYRKPDLRKIRAAIPWRISHKDGPTGDLEKIIEDIKRWKMTGKVELQ